MTDVTNVVLLIEKQQHTSKNGHESGKEEAAPGSLTLSSRLTLSVVEVDILVHSLANGPEVTKPLLETSRKACMSGILVPSIRSLTEIEKIRDREPVVT